MARSHTVGLNLHRRSPWDSPSAKGARALLTVSGAQGRRLGNSWALLFFSSGTAYMQSNCQEPFDSHSPSKKNWIFYGHEGLLPFDSAVNAQVSLLMSMQIKQPCPSGRESALA